MTMSRLIVLIVVVCFLAISSPGFAEGRFFETIPDMPLMPGLEESVSDASVFDKPQGRIVEAVAVMNNVSPEQALDFYNKILPEFGWKAGKKPGSFVREREILTLSFEPQEGYNKLVFLLQPAG